MTQAISLFRPGLITLLIIMLQACTMLDLDYEQPTVALSSFKVLPSDGGLPSFEIGLRVINPNRQALSLEGIVYTVSLQGHEIVKGVGKDFPVIESYSQGELKLTGSPNLLAGIRLFTEMMSDPQQKLSYEFEARLDVGGLYPSIRIKEGGLLNLGQPSGEVD